MKKIYIILTHTGTLLSRIIRYWTKDEFSHISVALDEDLTPMYSFGRKNPYNAFIGCFVREEIHKGTFKRFKNTTAEVYSLLVTDEQYKKMEKVINYFIENKEKYGFNFIGLACVGINKRIKRKNRFYCAEFVKHVLKFSGITQVNKLPEIIKPEDFKQLENINLEFEGILKKYNKPKLLGLQEVQEILNKKISYT